MSSQRNEYSYASQFVGKLRAESEQVPIHVYTRLRLMTDGTAREIRENQSFGHDEAPQYVFASAEDLSLPPGLQATGHHYFMWQRYAGQHSKAGE